MDQGTLVKDSLMLLDLLHQKKMSIDAAALTFSEERGWRLTLAPEVFPGRRELYTQLVELLEPADCFQALALSDIDLIEPDSRAADDLRRMRVDRVKSFESVKLGRDFYREVVIFPRRDVQNRQPLGVPG